MSSSAAGNRVFQIANGSFLALIALVCLLPLVNVLAVSFSSSTAAAAGIVRLWPVEFTLKSYKYAVGNQEFVRSFLVSLERLVLGVAVNMLLTIVTAYPLSKDRATFRWRGLYVWFFFLTLLFSNPVLSNSRTMSTRSRTLVFSLPFPSLVW